MKLDFCLQRRGRLVVFAWARETRLGVYMGVRFSPAIENLSYFEDGRRQWLRFTFLPDGKRTRDEIPLADQSPISSIEHAELMVSRVVDLPPDFPASGTLNASAEATVITIADDYLRDCGRLSYEAYIVGLDHVTELTAKHGAAPDDTSHDSALVRLFPMSFYPRQVLAIIFRALR